MPGELLVEHGPDIYAACSRPECGTAAGCSCPRYSSPATEDLVTHVVALPHDGQVEVLRAMMRACAESGVTAEAMNASKIRACTGGAS